jgi:NTP pyrophosphatase (non-canonical NTP hydrolase)
MSLIESYIDNCTDTFNNQGNANDLKHLIMGVTSEAGEIVDLFKKIIGYGAKEDEKWVNLLNLELGDLLWYTSVLSLYVEVPCAFVVDLSSNNNLQPFDKFEMSAKLTHYSSNLFQKGTSNNEFKGSIYSIVACVNEICNHYNLEIEDVLLKNLEKLQKRHGSSFNKKANHEDGRNRFTEEL